MSLIMVDETGLNPLPPGVLVTISDAKSGAQVGQEYVQYGGGVAIDVQGAVAYVAQFEGTQAPSTSCAVIGSAIAGSNTTVVVPGYRSPLQTQAGATAAMAARYPRGDAWGGSFARKQGGVLWNLFSLCAAGPSTMDQFTGQLQAALRIQTCTGQDLDSWAFDFFGSFLLRYQDETDASYRSRVIAALQTDVTIDAIEAIVNAFYAATLTERAAAAQKNLAFDTSGSFDTVGGFDVYVPPLNPALLTPVVHVWDSQTQPALAAANDITVKQFVIQIDINLSAYAWYLDHSSVDVNAFLLNYGVPIKQTTAPDARLGALVNLCKAAGTRPIYLITDEVG